MQNASIIEKIQNQLKSKKALTLSPMGLALAACGGGETSDQPNSQGPNNSQSANSTTKGSLQPTTSDLWDRTLEVYGVKLVVGGAVGNQAEVPDEWAHKVAQSYVMLMDPTAPGINSAAQEQMKAVLAGEEGTWHAGAPTFQRILKGAFDEYPLTPSNQYDTGIDFYYGAGTDLLTVGSGADMVWYQNSTGIIGPGDGDIHEVYEHIMHTIHFFGVRGAVEGSVEALNYTQTPPDPKNPGDQPDHVASDAAWKTSELYLALKEAIDNDVFDPSGYSLDPMNQGHDFKVAAIEYTYLLNFSMWEMGKEFWSDENEEYTGIGNGVLEGEWSVTASDPAGVLAENPLGHALFMKYFDPVLSKPDFATLRSMFQDDDQGDSGYVPDANSPQAFVMSFVEDNTQFSSEEIFYDQLSPQTDLAFNVDVL